jgi:Domain of unknown function (DUF4388)
VIPQAISGTFTRDTLPDLLRQVAGREETGQLTLSARSLRAIVHFERGALIGARFGTNAGEEAFVRILALEAGTCAFEGGRASAVTITRSLEALLASAYVSERLTQEPVAMNERTVLSSREAEASKPVNLMRIHWQIIKHVDGERNLGQIADLIGLSIAQLERPVRDLSVAGLIGATTEPPSVSGTNAAPVVASGSATGSDSQPIRHATETKQTGSRQTGSRQTGSKQTGSGTGERKRTLFGLFSKATHETGPEPKAHHSGVTDSNPTDRSNSSSSNSSSNSSSSTNSGSIAADRAKPSMLERLLPSKPERGDATRTSGAGDPSGASDRPSDRPTERSSVPETRRISLSSEFVEPEFVEFLRKHLAVFVGPMAEFALLDAAESLGTEPNRVPVGQLAAFVELLTQEVMPERQAAFHAQVGPVVKRYSSRTGH